MDWKRSDTIALAAANCAQCRGLGLRAGRQENTQPCNCVLRAIFRACFARFRRIVENERSMTRISLEANPSRERKSMWGRKDEEYVADFCLVSRRALNESEYRIFKYHFLLGADWRLCCKKLNIDRGNFFHAVYRIQQRLGRVFRDLEPYGLYPLDDYFRGAAKRAAPLPVQKQNVVPIRPPALMAEHERLHSKSA